jgi:hypothetical protein
MHNIKVLAIEMKIAWQRMELQKDDGRGNNK